MAARDRPRPHLRAASFRTENGRRPRRAAPRADAHAAGGSGSQAARQQLVCVLDCAYEQDSPRALHSVGKQLSMLVGTNRRAEAPAALHAASFAGEVERSVKAKHAVASWVASGDLCCHGEAFCDVAELMDAAGGSLDGFVYMSPDGEEVLEGELDTSKVYIFAGLVDVNPPTPGISRARAETLGVRTARLPVRECYPGASASVMSIVTAFQAVVSRQSEPDWETTMAKVVPNRIKEARCVRARVRARAYACVLLRHVNKFLPALNFPCSACRLTACCLLLLSFQTG